MVKIDDHPLLCEYVDVSPNEVLVDAKKWFASTVSLPF